MADDEEVDEEALPEAHHESDTTITPVEAEKSLDPPKYEVRPGLGERFQAENVSEIIVTTMQEQLSGRQYRADQASRWVKLIAAAVRHRVQELGMKRYKILVQSTIIEMKGAGVKCGHRCIWDPETDDYAQSMYRNDTLCCHTVVYGVYMY